MRQETSAILKAWRAGPFAILPLFFLHAFSSGLTEHYNFVLYQNVHCDAYRTGNVLNQTYNQTQDNMLYCYSPDVTNAVSTSIDQQYLALTILVAVMSGVCGVLCDSRSRKYVMVAGTVVRAIGDFLLFLCLRSSVLTTANAVLLTALFTGLAGGSYVVPTAQLAFLTDTSSPTKRTLVLGLALAMMPIGTIVAVILSTAVTAFKLYGVVFSVSMITHSTYLAYLTFCLRELRKPPQLEAVALEEKQSSMKKWVSNGALFPPMVMIFSDSTLRWLAMVALCLSLVSQIPSTVQSEVGEHLGVMPLRLLVTTLTAITLRVLVAFCLIPAFVLLYRKYATRHQRTPIQGWPTQDGLSIVDIELDNAPKGTNLHGDSIVDVGSGKSRFDCKVAVRQELLLCLICFVVKAMSLALIPLSRNASHFSVAYIVDAFSSPVDASLFTLTTLATEPGQIGRVLMGVSVIEDFAHASRKPLLSAISKATLEKTPFTACWFAAGICVLCAVMIARLRPEMFREDDRH